MNEELIKLFLAVGVYPLLVILGILFVVPLLVDFLDRPKKHSTVSHRIRK